MADRSKLPSVWVSLWVGALVTSVYFAAGKGGLMLAFVHASASAVWPPTGIALAAFLVLGYRVWPAVLLGAFLVNITTAGTVATSLGIATGNTLECLVGAFLVNRFAGGRHALERVATLLRYTLLAGLLCTTISATFGVTSLALGGFADWASYGRIWVTWWLGDAAGAIIVAPVLLTWSTSPAPRWIPARAVEAAVMLASTALVGLLVFSTTLPLIYLCSVLLIWPALRFGPRETATAIFVLSGIAIWDTLAGRGPFVAIDPNQSLLLLQAFMGVKSVVMLVLTALVSERTQAQADRKFRTLLETAPDAMVIVDVEGRIVLVNSQAEKLFGYDREELVGEAIEMLVPSRFRDRHVVHRGGFVARPTARPMGAGLELFGRHKDGHEIPVEISLSPMEVDGVVLVSSAIRDITTRRAAEQSLRRANEELHQAQQRAVQAERLAAIGHMEAGLAHEGRNALQQIQAAVEMLAPSLQEKPEARFVVEIQRAEERLHRLFEDVRGYAAPLNLECRMQSLPALWREAWDQMRPLRDHRDARLDEDTGDMDLDCFVDPFCVERVFHNILLNALGACRGPARIQVHCSETDLDGRSAVCVTIRDNGPGFTPEQHGKLFEPFYTTKARGTGLGMAISKRIVEAHGGRITARNGAAAGAEVEVLLPRASR